MVHFATRLAVAVFIVCVFPGVRPLPRAQGTVQITNDAAGQRQQLQAVRTVGRIILDGALDDPAWREAPTARNFTQNEPREGEPGLLKS